MIKIKPIDVTIIIDFPAESNTLKPKFMIRDHVRILNYKKKKLFSDVHKPNWMEDVWLR